MKQSKLTHGSLFSGIEGFGLGAAFARIKTLWSCEYEDYQASIIKKNFGENHEINRDIRTYSKPTFVDIISGGFPCQDISVAGKGVGIVGERSGLWTEMYRVIREVRPKYIIIENSPMLLIRGFERVLCDLSEIGYDAEWQCLSNADFGFDHRRERLYVIAYSNKVKRQAGRFQEWNQAQGIFVPPSNQHCGFSIAQRVLEMPDREHIGINDGIRGWTHRVGCLGNAVNPVVAKYLFECIILYENKIS